MFVTLSYHDGSANTYRFRADGDGATFEYDPVQPEHSSTGRYSGGDPRAGRLCAVRTAELWKRVQAFERDRSLHVDDRMKGTGEIVIDDGNGLRAFIVKRCAALAAFDAFLASL